MVTKKQKKQGKEDAKLISHKSMVIKEKAREFFNQT
jgi:hypothetical protein